MSKKNIFTKEELCFINVFDNLISKKTNANNTLDIEKMSFTDKLEILKTFTNTKKLYKTLLELIQKLNEEQAQKYLIGFLEYKDLSFEEYVVNLLCI